MVQRGDTSSLRQWASAAPPVRAGLLASDQLRQLKNTFIVTATVTSRAAIRGGLSEEEAFSLSDAFIQQAELLQTQGKIVELQYNMILEFAEQVEKMRRGENPGKLAFDVANYVRCHLSEPIRTEEVAKTFYLTRTHFAAKFKKETGKTLTDFILNEKTEEAKRLLRYSDKSAAAIATYLGFSSHGHFVKVFKKYAGITPGEYREKLL
jgi:AraC-like DNA-binding protein